MTILQTTEALREADRYSDKYGITTVLLICVILLLLLAVWKVILPMFKDAQAKYEAAMQARIEKDEARTREFLSALKEMSTSHKDEVNLIMESLKREQRKDKR